MFALRFPRWFVKALLSSVLTVSSAIGQQVIATVANVPNPFSMAFNAVTNKLYVANEFVNTVTVIDGTDFSTQTVAVGNNPRHIAVNQVTNKIYVANMDTTVTVIDGSTLSTVPVQLGSPATNLAVNSVTNKIYVTNVDFNTVTIIDGATLSVRTVRVSPQPEEIAVNQATNKIYVVSGVNGTPGFLTQIDGATLAAQTISVGNSSANLVINSVTNTIYVVNACGDDPNLCSIGTVSVVDGATMTSSSVTVGVSPYGLDVNPVTNKIYVGNFNVGAGSTVTVIDGTDLSTQTVNVGLGPETIAVNAVTNKIYAVASESVTVIDGVTNATASVTVGDGPEPLAVDTVRNRVYVGNFIDDTVSVIGWYASTPNQFAAVTPCRLVDTRRENGGNGPIGGRTSESFNLSQISQTKGCGDLSSAAAYSLNVTVIPHGRLGYLTIWPTGQPQPVVSLMNSLDGRIKANATIVPGGTNSAVTIYVTNTTDVLIDIDGYFGPAGTQTLQFYPLAPCRVVDTRNPNSDLAGPFLAGSQKRDFPILESSCIPAGSNPAAYSFNVTAVPHPTGQRLGFLTLWPQGDPQPTVSTLNNLTGTIVANAAIVPAGPGGEISAYPNNDTDLLIDINGYFAAPSTGGLSLYTMFPCRMLDTRGPNGNQPPFIDELTVNVVHSTCMLPDSAQAYVFNATVVPPARLGFLTLWPDGEPQPGVSTLNAIDGAISSNMAIVPTSNGSVDAYANDLTQLIMDISSYFAP